MKRDLQALSTRQYDLIVVGGGIFGVCAAWEAVLRGLSVAIVEKGDFSHATSANHFKMVHGGIRYLQHADLYRVRESSRERSALLRIAPHLVKPLPIVIPTYGHGIKGKGVLRAGMMLYDALTADRNRGIHDAQRRIPPGRSLSRQQVLALFPGIESEGLTGAAVFCDGQMYNPPRLAVSFLRSAVSRGADAANYVEAEAFLRKGNRIYGIKARDAMSGSTFEIRGRMVLNAAGPWAHGMLERTLGIRTEPRPTFSRDLAFVVHRRPGSDYGLAFPSKSKDLDTILDRGGRHLFAVPWRDYTLFGVWHKVFDGSPEEIRVTGGELEGFVSELNEAYPGLDLHVDEISMINTGLTLFGDENRQQGEGLSFGKRSQLIDHLSRNGLEGCLTLIGVRATTARGMAQRAVDLAVRRLAKKAPKSVSEITPIFGGRIDGFQAFLQDAVETNKPRLEERVVRSLVHNYGSEYPRVLRYVEEDPALGGTLGKSWVLKAEVVHAVREEMALRLSDVAYRRTDLGTAGRIDEEALRECARLMAMELGWDARRLREELDAAREARFPAPGRQREPEAELRGGVLKVAGE